MLNTYLQVVSLEGTLPTQPFIGDDPQRILITGWARHALKLFGSHIMDRPTNIFVVTERLSAMRHRGNAEISQHNPIISTQKHVLWLHISMDNLPVVSILERRG